MFVLGFKVVCYFSTVVAKIVNNSRGVVSLMEDITQVNDNDDNYSA